MALKSNCTTLPKIAPDEEMFVLRAQDASAAKTVALWIAENILTAPEQKLKEALDCALRMRLYHGMKPAD
jgi:hypothetical protein